MFDLATLWANVTEEQPKGLFVTRVVANDADEGMNAEIEYKLQSNGKQFLKINSTTGVVTTLVLFDFEVQRNHTFKVTASDKGRIHVTIGASGNSDGIFVCIFYTFLHPTTKPRKMQPASIHAREPIVAFFTTAPGSVE